MRKLHRLGWVRRYDFIVILNNQPKEPAGRISFSLANLPPNMPDVRAEIDGVYGSPALLLDSRAFASFFTLYVGPVDPCEYVVTFSIKDAMHRFGGVIFGVFQNVFQAVAVATSAHVQEARRGAKFVASPLNQLKLSQRRRFF